MEKLEKVRKILGIDIGSRFTKLAYGDGEFPEFELIDSIEFYKNIDEFKSRFKDFKVVATGYGRYNLSVLNAKIIPEIIAHVLGVSNLLNLKDFTLVDIGGQDTKVVRVENGVVSDFTTNDKCAASSGRFLENMANVLKIELERLLDFYENPININSTCAVFTESEVIGAISRGEKLESVASGINYALFSRLKPWIKEQKSQKIVLTGGIATSKALSFFIQREFSDCEIIIPENAQFLGALGCYYKLKS